MSLDNPFVALEPAIIAACANHEKDNFTVPGYRRLIGFANYIIKFGDSLCFSSEVQMHDRFAKVTEKDLTAPRVPLIYHSFKHGHLTFAIIEPLQLIPVAEDIFVQKVADAVLWMYSQTCPAGVTLGPLGSGFAWHEVFKDYRAPLPFTSVVALEKYLNVAVSLQQRRQKGLANISISGERLTLTQSDMDPSNFGIDETGRVVIFDFCEIGWLPESLANYTLLCTGQFASKVAARVFGDHLDSVRASSNLTSLIQVRVLLCMAATLGLDKDGNHISKNDGSKPACVPLGGSS